MLLCLGGALSDHPRVTLPWGVAAGGEKLPRSLVAADLSCSGCPGTLSAAGPLPGGGTAVEARLQPAALSPSIYSASNLPSQHVSAKLTLQCSHLPRQRSAAVLMCFHLGAMLQC
eukprot:360006-Chlamydomonas_euryale.AAC.1